MIHTLTVLPGGDTLAVQRGESLLEALRAAGLPVEAPCGGHGTCGKCLVRVDGEEVRACQYRVEGDLTVELPRQADTNILTGGQTAAAAVNPAAPGYLLAYDVGTTTVVCFLLSPSGEELAAESMLNPQSPYGADVITRIQRAVKGDMAALTAAIRAGMADLAERACRRAGISPSEIGVVSVVGNPCMQQLFLGIPPDNLAAVPFLPALTQAEIRAAGDCLPLCAGAQLLVVPDISGYVGADTMACILAARLYEAEDTVLLVDIGTNGEMALAHRGRLTACSTAAGPALEGANISCGMRGAAGAIDHVWAEGGAARYSVIGGVEAHGLCGSGLIDAVAYLLDAGQLNKRGRLAAGEAFRLSEAVALTQEDIRQVQMAKGAIAAGIRLMAAHLGITAGDIDRVILAGAFGSFLRPESACRIGLLPEELAGKITAAGNIAGSGAKLLALDRSQLDLSQALLDRVEFLELAQEPLFQRTFAQNMTFREAL